MKNLSQKQKIIFICTLIFFCTSVAVKIKNFNSNIQSINKKKDIIQEKVKQDSIKSSNNTLNTLPEKSKEKLNLKSNEKLQNDEDVNNRISEIRDTLEEAINYLKNNIDNKDKKEEIRILIDDCINALNSIENASTKIKYKDDIINANKDIKKLKEDFKELQKSFKEGNLDKCKEILDKS
ncbi:hypothetical protein RBU49_03440 [Clostridium sp. MB40-C1]|uniref:hypothetical protein n=1 Tax=Clostridium sp. MB40-C1 TaxID=3070996 RepID=UPI0027DFB5B9|nr:hypothetical protein [Clostridium sp. MB40-C1]WMJ81324.1 hypothetical protein RBU49_03440 [Clostridium sp. MB40-C1]